MQTRLRTIGVGFFVALVWFLLETLRFKLLLTGLAVVVLPRRSNAFRWVTRWLGVASVALSLWLMPSVSGSSNSRARVVFFDASGAKRAAPWFLNLTNLVPEMELARISTLLAPIFPFPTSGRLLAQVRAIPPFDNAVIREYRTLVALGFEDEVPSLLPLQLAQQLGAYREVHAATLILPSQPRTKPSHATIFLHGYMGALQLYDSFWADDDEAAVLIPATRDLTGLWSLRELDFVLGPQLDALAKETPVDRAQLHVVGLSNGGSGVNRLLASKPSAFRSLTWLSTWVDPAAQEPVTGWPELAIVSGRDDGIAENNLEMARRLASAGARVSVHRYAAQGHLVMLNRREKVLADLRGIRHTRSR